MFFFNITSTESNYKFHEEENLEANVDNEEEWRTWIVLIRRHHHIRKTATQHNTAHQSTSHLSIHRSVLFFSHPRSEGWPHHGRTFSIYPCPHTTTTKWSKRWRGFGMAVPSAGPYANHLHLAPGRWPHQHLITQYLQAGCSSWHPTDSVKALKASLDTNTIDTDRWSKCTYSNYY